MEPADVIRIREALLAQRAALLEEGAVKVRKEGDDPVASAADEDEAPHHEMDQAIASARNKERVATLTRIERALARVAEDPDSYGVCDVCGEDIAIGRLVLLPFAVRCAPCQADAEQKRTHTRKKVTDYL